MKHVIIHHPLRTISYQIDESSFSLDQEAKALENYRRAHDQVWRMKLLFEKETGEAQLALIDLYKLNEKRQELQEMFNFYKEQFDPTDKDLLITLEYGFQVELRDFYNSVLRHHYALIRFYDIIAVRDREYIDISNTYIRNEKPIDPLNFKVLDPLFANHSDMQADVVSLDKDLQQFLTVLTDVYALLDNYIQQYNVFYRAYSEILKKTAELTKDVQVLRAVWGDQ